MADTDHWSSTPRLAANAIVAELRAQLLRLNGGAGAPGGGGSGCVRTVARVSSLDEEVVHDALNPGLPGLLVYYEGGPMAGSATHQQLFKVEMSFRVLCCAGTFEAVPFRLSGQGDMDSAAAISPGVEELQDWALRFAVRALESVAGVCKVKPQRMLPSMFVRAGLYVGAVLLVATREIDVYDESSLITLQDIGIVHDPADYAALWSDPPTDEDPNSETTAPDGMDGGAGELSDL